MKVVLELLRGARLEATSRKYGVTASTLTRWQVIDLAGAAKHEDLCEAAHFYFLERLRLTLEEPAATRTR